MCEYAHVRACRRCSFHSLACTGLQAKLDHSTRVVEVFDHLNGTKLQAAAASGGIGGYGSLKPRPPAGQPAARLNAVPHRQVAAMLHAPLDAPISQVEDGEEYYDDALFGEDSVESF